MIIAKSYIVRSILNPMTKRDQAIPQLKVAVLRDNNYHIDNLVFVITM